MFTGGSLVSGQTIEGLNGLRAVLLEQPNRFPTTVTEKLLAYAPGRRLEYYDQPVIRRIVHDAAPGSADDVIELMKKLD